MKRCGVCRGTYRGSGRRVVADGRFRVACPACTGRAVLVVQTVVAGCACGKTAAFCASCCERVADRAHRAALESGLGKLRAILATFKGTVPPEDERAYVEGIIDGVERSISVLVRRA